MKRVWISMALLTLAAALQIGCGNACDSASDRIYNRYVECKFDLTEDDKDTNAVCSEADAAYLDCRADCAESATCEALHAEDPQGALDFSNCNKACN